MDRLPQAPVVLAQAAIHLGASDAARVPRMTVDGGLRQPDSERRAWA